MKLKFSPPNGSIPPWGSAEIERKGLMKRHDTPSTSIPPWGGC